MGNPVNTQATAHPVVAAIEAERQRQQLAGMIALGCVITDLLTYRPPKREHWWQFWREAK